MLTQIKNGFHCQADGCTVRTESYGPGVIRVRAARGPVRDLPWTVLPAGPDEPRFYREGETGILENEALCARITEDGHPSFTDRNGHLLLAERWNTERDQPARKIRGLTGGLFYLEQSFEPHREEHFYGLGQEAHDLFDLKGAVLDLCQQNTKSTIPFVISSEGYGFLWNNPAVGRVEFGTSGTRWVAQTAAQIDYFVIGGRDLAEIERRYASLTGYAPELPAWATGLWQSKLRYETQEELLSVAREYHKRKIPLSLIVCDYFHWPQQGEWKFDPKYWPDPGAMVRELSEMGIRLLVSIWPTVDPRSENYLEMRDRGLLVGTERGPDVLTFCRGPETYYDTTNPEAGAFVWQKVKENYYRYGIRNFWLDEAEPEIAPYDYDNLRFWIGPGQEVSCLYPWYYAQNFYEGLRQEGQTEIVNLIRCAFTGSQRFGIVLWSGDIQANFDSLRRQIKTGLHVALSGIPWWTTDIGGFHGGDPADPAYRECFVRWFQFGAFCPIFRVHGFRFRKDRPVSAPYSMDGLCPSGGPNELWSFGEEACEIMKSYVMLRERLRPYIGVQMRQAAADGTPVMRPVFYDFQQKPFYEVFDQYMFGPDIMVCPVYEAGKRSRTVILPEGADWVEPESRQVFAGGRTVELAAPLSRIPLLLRAGGTLSCEMFEQQK